MPENQELKQQDAPLRIMGLHVSPKISIFIKTHGKESFWINICKVKKLH
jgi:hypothetical protein